MKAAELISRQLLETWKHQYCTEENPKDWQAYNCCPATMPRQIAFGAQRRQQREGVGPRAESVEQAKTHRNKNAQFFWKQGVLTRLRSVMYSVTDMTLLHINTYNLLKLYATSVCVVCCVVASRKTPEIEQTQRFQ